MKTECFFKGEDKSNTPYARSCDGPATVSVYSKRSKTFKSMCCAHAKRFQETLEIIKRDPNHAGWKTPQEILIIPLGQDPELWVTLMEVLES